MAPEIEVLSARQSWRRELDPERTTVGKASENDIVLADDPTVSHVHAVIERFAASWCITDLGSSNGTWLNGIPLKPHQPVTLRSGDRLVLARLMLQVYIP